MEKRKYSDRRETLLKAVTEKRRRVKLLAVQLGGGKCVICGYNKYRGALDLHHVFGRKKFSLGGTGYSHSWKDIKKEISKCVLLCSNCHREVGGGVTLIPKAVLVKKNMCKMR
jgi:hypothetical protein